MSEHEPPVYDKEAKRLLAFMARAGKQLTRIQNEQNSFDFQLRTMALAAMLDQWEIYLSRLETYETRR